MSPHLQRTPVNPGALHRAVASLRTAANPRIKAEAILLTIRSCFSPKSIHNRTVKLMFPLLLQTIVKMIGICPQRRARLLHPQAKSSWKGRMCEKHVLPGHADNGVSETFITQLREHRHKARPAEGLSGTLTVGIGLGTRGRWAQGCVDPHNPAHRLSSYFLQGFPPPAPGPVFVYGSSICK